jgi:hypothetical protein
VTEFLRRVGGGGIFVVLFALLAFLVLKVFPPVGALEIKRAAREFAAAWQSDRLDTLTYDPGSGPDIENGDAGAIKENSRWLVRDLSTVDADRPISVVTSGEPSKNMDGEATQTLSVTWQLDAGRRWTYDTELVMRNSQNRWRVLWRPSTIHPFLQHGLVLKSTRVTAARAPIQDADIGTLAPAGPAGLAGELVGDVRTATPELAEIGPGRVVPGDQVGISGLQQQYDERLAGQGGVEVDIVTDPRFAPLEPVVRQAYVSPPTPGKPLVLTLDRTLQQKAENALKAASITTPAALVAVDTTHGDVLAVANGGKDDQQEKGLQGQFPPGAVFRLPTMLALIRDAGATAQTETDCRPIRYLGQQFTNPANVPADAVVPLSTAFAENCVTGFASAARSVTGRQLQSAAQALGYQVPGALGTPSYDGLVPATNDPLELVENAIGEGTVLASPLAVARASATVASGEYHASTLVAQPPQPIPANGPVLSAAEQNLLQQLMIASVRTDPAQRALAAIGNGQVAAISGIASYGPAAAATKHAWCTGYQGNVAFAVLVTNATEASQAAAVAAAFLS